VNPRRVNPGRVTGHIATERLMKPINAHTRPADRRTTASAGARVAARSADSNRACHWAVVAALAIFLAVMLVQIGG
jgi:hypothetical protein